MLVPGSEFERRVMRAAQVAAAQIERESKLTGNKRNGTVRLVIGRNGRNIEVWHDHCVSDVMFADDVVYSG